MTGKILIAGGVFLACLTPAWAQDAKAGRDKAQMCVGCHGALGLAEVPNAPNLAGVNPVYFSQQIKAYKSGKRENHQMTIIASGLSDHDVADLAAWYAAIEVTVTAPDLD